MKIFENLKEYIYSFFKDDSIDFYEIIYNKDK